VRATERDWLNRRHRIDQTPGLPEEVAALLAALTAKVHDALADAAPAPLPPDGLWAMAEAAVGAMGTFYMDTAAARVRGEY
jgi:hypothetical protein